MSYLVGALFTVSLKSSEQVEVEKKFKSAYQAPVGPVIRDDGVVLLDCFYNDLFFSCSYPFLVSRVLMIITL